ncbi:MAG: hypothetical protein E3J80_01330 [Hadesarchaea archaeon]|nr:MAG: hypothetical protein E3J80_01330 [Hadesarchaea archaeon]
MNFGGGKPAAKAKPALKGDGEPLRNQEYLGRDWLRRPVVGAEARAVGKRPRDEKRRSESCAEE